jgi:alkylated DNA repair dioxygenase AlkB
MNNNENEILTYRDDQIKSVEKFLTKDEADKYFNIFLKQISWKQGHIKLFGKDVLIPREQCWIADEGITYSYSNKPLQRFSWSKELLELRARIEGFCSHKFNSVLANLYRDGNDSMGWHADNEMELGLNPTIVSISLGAERALKVRDNKTKEIIKIDQKHGSLLIMQKGMQSTTQHSISKTKLDIGARINLTFRNIITPQQKEQK